MSNTNINYSEYLAENLDKYDKKKKRMETIKSIFNK